MPPFPSLTNTWHSEPYDAISPTRPELSAKGKVVVITGGGGSIGRATTHSFAKAGSTKIAVIGRRAEPLEETKAKVEADMPGCSVLVIQGDIADAASIKSAIHTVKEKFGSIDIFVANAGYLSLFESVASAAPDEWWKGFEINTKGAFNTARALLSEGNLAEAAIIVDVSTCVVHMPAMANGSAYVSSKLAATKIWEMVSAENDKVEVVHVHPGVVYSDINVKSGITASDDCMSLPLSALCFSSIFNFGLAHQFTTRNTDFCHI